MKPWLTDPDVTLYHGDALEVLKELPSASVDMVCTSPPYWGLRDYGVDGQIGLEETPELFVARLVEVFREVRRVLSHAGTVWLNLGDSYSSNPKGISGDDSSTLSPSGTRVQRQAHLTAGRVVGLKIKDLVGVPWRVAFALQQPYYTGRIKDERDRAWLAAMIDGEGTICGFRHERPDGNIRTGCLTFITNSSEAILDECDRIWPGSRYVEKLKPGDRVLGGTATKTCWRWELQSAEDRSALVRELYPYLIEKKRQALVAWNMLELVQAAKRMGRGGETAAVKEKRDYLARTLSDLNQRRPVDLPSWLQEPPSLLEPGWYLRSDIIWSKNNPMPESVTDRPTKSHEYLFLLSKQPRYFFDADAIAEPAAWERWGDQTVPKYAGTDTATGWIKPKTKQELVGENRPAGRGDTYSGFNGRYAADDPAARKTRNARSVWEIPPQPYPDSHFAVFPEELVRRCVLAGCPEGGTVLDPFVGSGTTCAVTRKHGRRSIGIDLSEPYLELAAKRLQQLSLLSELSA